MSPPRTVHRRWRNSTSRCECGETILDVVGGVRTCGHAEDHPQCWRHVDGDACLCVLCEDERLGASDGACEGAS